MSDNYVKFENLLQDLKHNYYLNALKIDFASEIITEKELSNYNILARNNNIDLTIKIGGCEALSDMYFAKKYNAKNILVPMVETPYALIKTVNTLKQIFEKLEEINIYINIETITGINNFSDILSVEEAKYIKGIVLGRDDLTQSYNLDLEYINSNKILELVLKLADKVSFYNKEFTIGGKILRNAENFLKQIPISKLDKIETRRLVFNKEILVSDLYKSGILKALLFEYLWLKENSVKIAVMQKRTTLLEKFLKDEKFID